MSRDALSSPSGKPQSSPQSQQTQDGDKKLPELKPSLVSFREPLSKPRPHVKIAAHKSGRRQLAENEHHKLLTPPLTPSSSIRTNASVDSSVGDSFSGDQSAQVTGGDDDDACPSRFLLISNVSPDVPQEVVKNAISSSLTTPKLACYRPDSKLPTPVTPSMDDIATKIQNGRARQPLDNPIKGLFVQSQEEGITIFLAFHDLRDAIAAKNYFDTRESDVFDECVGQGKDGAGRQRLICKYLTMEQVTSKLGTSGFLKSMDASFDLIAEDDVPVDEAIQGLKLANDESSEEKNVGVSARGIVLLKTYLETFGHVRLFVQDERQASNAVCRTFRVEFYDIREAASAYESLRGSVAMFGMKIRVSGRDDLVENAEHTDPEPIQAKPAEKPAIVPFPISRAFDDSIQPFGPPGQLSQTREPFSFPIDTSVNDALSVSSENRSTGSPPFFYTSQSPVRAYASSAGVSNKGRVNRTVLDPQQQLQHQLIQHYYNPSTDGYPYPLHDGDPSTPIVAHPYYPSTPTPPPIPYHHGYLSPPPPHFPGALHGVPGAMVPFEHDPSMMPPMNIAWPIDMMNGLPPYPSGYPVGAGAVSPGHDAFWVQGVTPTNFPNGTPSYFPHGQPRMPPGYFAGDQQFVPIAPSTQEGSPRRNGSSSSSPHLTKNSAAPSPGSSTKKESSEHNQLNLAKIEEGADTRTTVMIKNIPNKMTDKDLMAYIGKVCHRRIDFLYLRMDFKNGCNVGYAFVNFISVQDLLTFAKKRLGQKWNMFSSEKVLQMSYANYQGKEALVEKFKNSCTMDEREAWQPKIFYSEPGPEQGLPEPFPVATHQRRKERSSHNRGTLYVPGNSTLQNQNMLHPSFNSRKLEHNEPRYRERNHRRQRTTTTGE